MGLSEMTNCYGQTETSPVSFQSHSTTDFLNKISSVGVVHPNVEAKIIDEEGKIVPKGVQGELCVKGYLVMAKYWNDPEKTRETIDEEGWCKSGDLAEMNEEGYVKITGRVKDMIIRGGENIYPIEIESYLMRHPAIRDVQVIGVSDEKMGQEVCACIIPHGDPPSLDDLRDFCTGQIAHYKIPKYVRFVKEYPMTVTGKIKKNIMREETD